MSSEHQPIEDTLLENTIRRFESSWFSGERPQIDEYLGAATADQRHALLVELVHTELECRLKARVPARVEEYLQRYPELASDQAAVLELIGAEYEILRRIDDVEVEGFLARFPDFSDKLRVRLASAGAPRGRRRFPLRLNCPHCQNPIEVVADEKEEDLLCPSCGSTFRLNQERTISWTPERLPQLGKFELLEAVGRGAFGTVYRARDTELDRIVAVKVPRSGRLVTQDDEDRFIREARSVAQLSHAGIVPVYEVGRSESFSYVVAEYIDGIDLADALTGRRFGFRESAELIAQVAEALAHAHQAGVVHRDLKPSNIMLTAEGRPRLMDFGLAKRETGEITMTLEGQVLGTPAYMSPEQAGGEAHQVDGRSDVYSLGVILYQLLTGELPFRGNQRMLLHQVLHDEPRTPRSLNDRIPRNLETICLKALAKEVGRRYQSAGELADELRRFLGGEPILARPARRIEKAWRWCRRRPAVAGLSAAVVLALVVGTVTSTSFAVIAARNAEDARLNASLAKQNSKDAEKARQRALLSLQGERLARLQAQNNLEESHRQQKLAEVNLAEAEHQRQRAEASLRQARAAVDEYFSKVSEADALIDNPKLQPLRKELVESALRFYEHFTSTTTADSPELQADLAAAHFRLAAIRHGLGMRDDWIPEIAKATDLVAQLLDQDVSYEQIQGLATGLYRARGQTAIRLPTDLKNAATVLQDACEVIENLSSKFPQAHGFRNDLAGISYLLAFVQMNLGNGFAATVTAARAGSIWEELVQSHPDVPDYRLQLGNYYVVKADMLDRLKSTKGAQESVRQSVEVLAPLVAKFPDNAYYLDAHTRAQIQLACFLSRANEHDKAVQEFARAMEHREQLAKEFPENDVFRVELAKAYKHYADHFERAVRYDRAIEYGKKSLSVYDELFRTNPDRTRWRRVELAFVAHDLSRLFRRQGCVEDAVGYSERAVESYDQIHADFQDHAAVRQDLSVLHFQFASVLRDCNRTHEAAEVFAKTAHMCSELFHERPQDVECAANLAEVLYEQAVTQLISEDVVGFRATCATLLSVFEEDERLPVLEWVAAACLLTPDAIDGFGRALALADRMASGKPRNARHVETLAIALYRAGRYEAALQRLKDVAELREALTVADGMPRYDWYFQAMAHQRLGHNDESQTWLQRAVDWTENATGGQDGEATTLSWSQRATLSLFRHEAEQLIGDSANSQQAPAGSSPR